MSWKSYVTATCASALVATVLGCDSDPVSSEPDPDPISVTGVYDYTFDVNNGESGDDEIGCSGHGVVTFTQQSDATFTAETVEDGLVVCVGFGGEISDSTGVVVLEGELSDTEVTFQFPLPEVSELCEASGEVEGNPVTGLSGTATCVIDLSALEPGSEPVTLSGTWQADRHGG